MQTQETTAHSLCPSHVPTITKKKGYIPPVIEEVEPEEDDEAGEKDQQNGSLTAEAQKGEMKHPDTGLAMTPIQSSRSSVKLPFFSGRKPPRCPVVTVGSSSLFSCETLRKPDFLQQRLKFEKKLQIVSEDESPDILKGSCSPPMSSGVKTTSPNRSKRVSPPHNEFGSSSAGQRGGRKLILRSIPPFPSLTHDGALFR